MLHRVLLGSLERFIGALLEHYKADLPLWLAPVQVLIIPIKDSAKEYCLGLKKKIESNSIRVQLDDRNETLDKRIRQAELNKIPYSLVVGDREVAANTVSVRKRGEKNLGVISPDKFIEDIKKLITDRG